MIVHAAFALGGVFGSVWGQGGTGRPVLAPLHLSVEMIQKVTQELVGILLLVTPAKYTRQSSQNVLLKEIAGIILNDSSARYFKEKKNV